MKVFDNIKNKNIDELAEWLDKYCTFEDSPWNKWYDENYCSKCKPIKSSVANDFGYTSECCYCELNGNCKFFKDMKESPNSKQIIEMWLESEFN